MQPSTASLNTTAPSRRLVMLAVAVPTAMAIVGAALLAHSPSAWAQATAPAAAPTADFAAALARFQQAGPNNADAVEDAAERFTRLLAAAPADPVLRAYAGAATTMRATTTALPWRKLTFAEDGLALIDKAMAQLNTAHDAPLHRGVAAALETRFTAASTFLSLPSMFNRNERGRKQLEQVLNSPLLDSAPAPFRAAVWLRAARLAEQDQQAAQAREWYQKVAASGAPEAAAATERLKAL